PSAHGTEVSHPGSTPRAGTMPASPTSRTPMATTGCYRNGATEDRKGYLRSEVVAMFNRIKSPTWAPVPLRLIIGFGFMEHGYAKLLKGPDAFAYILYGLGVPAPHLMAWLTIVTELLGGFAVLLGAFVTLVSVPMAVVLLTAILSVHWRYGFSSIKLLAVTPVGGQFGPPGYGWNLVSLGCLGALVISGPGA